MAKIAFFDIDGTIYKGHLIIPLSSQQYKDGIIDITCLNQINNDFNLYKSGQVNYENSITNFIVHWAQGLKEKSFDKVLKHAQKFITKQKENFYPYSYKIFDLLKEKGYETFFVTAEPDFLAQVVFEQFNLTGFTSSKFEIIDRLFTGNTLLSLAKKENKEQETLKLLNTYNKKDSLAFGDSEGDIEMLKLVEKPICINPTEGLRKIAQEKDWLITIPEEVISLLNL